jgi:hypothetical protein
MDSMGSYGNTTIVTKSMDYWDKKIKELQRIFSELLSNKVLESLSTFTSRRDMAGAWNELNRRYFSRLAPYTTTITAALRSYVMRHGQVLSNYIWCLEIVYEACVEMLGGKYNQQELLNMLIRGIKDHNRYKSICDMVFLQDVKPDYNKFKEKILSIETEREIERTMMATLEKSIDRMKNTKGSSSKNNKASGM